MRFRSTHLLFLSALLSLGACAEKYEQSAKRDTSSSATGVVVPTAPTPTAMAEQARVMAERYLRTHEHIPGEIEMEGKPRDDGPWTVVTMRVGDARWNVWVNPATNETRDAVQLTP